MSFIFCFHHPPCFQHREASHSQTPSQEAPPRPTFPVPGCTESVQRVILAGGSPSGTRQTARADRSVCTDVLVGSALAIESTAGEWKGNFLRLEQLWKAAWSMHSFQIQAGQKEIGDDSHFSVPSGLSGSLTNRAAGSLMNMVCLSFTLLLGFIY